MLRRLIVLLLLGGSGWAAAHHSTSEYEGLPTREIDGTVIRVFWRNPHVMIHVETADRVWRLEGASVSSLRRRGLTQDMVQVGDRVKAAGPPSSRREQHILVENLLLPGGEELLIRRNAVARWPEASVYVARQPDAESAETAANADGIFRVWTWGRLSPGWWFFAPPENFPLTETAKAQAATWNEFTDNPQLDCIAPGMPATMGNPYPIEFRRVGSNIELRQEEFDVVRTLHIGQRRDSAPTDSPLGYSVGEWEDSSTLVVKTTNIDWPYFNRVGVPQSDAVEVHERFVVDDEAGRLSYRLTVTDPATLTVPYEYDALWVWEPTEVLGRYDCRVETD
ncbi:MAG: DUF6152 family protein [Pseudomonadota bacterium]